MTSERTTFARSLCQQPTRAEAILWERLRGSSFEGAIPGLGPGDRRQVPFDRFVVDFYCHAAKLVVHPGTAIRGDGKQHKWFSDYDSPPPTPGARPRR